MKTLDIVPQMVDASGKSRRQIAREMGMSDSYLNPIFGRGSIPRADTLLKVASACGFDLYAVNRETGNALRILPPDEKLVPDEGVKSPQARGAKSHPTRKSRPEKEQKSAGAHLRGILSDGTRVYFEDV